MNIINFIIILLFLKYNDIKLKYNYLMYLYCVMSDYKLQTTSCAGRMIKIRYPQRRASNVKNPTTDRRFRMSNIRHSNGRASDVESLTFD